MSERFLPEDDETVAFDSSDKNVQTTEQHKPKPKPSAGINTGKSGKQGWLADKKNLAIYGALAVGLGILVWYLLDDGTTPSAQTSAGQIATSDQPRTTQTTPSNENRGMSSDVIKQFSNVLLQQRAQINELAQQTAQLNGTVTQQQNQINQLEQEITSLSISGNRQVTRAAAPQGYINSTLLTGMTLNDIQPDLAWINYKGQVHALQVGDSLAGAQVVRIDMQRRVVITTKGLIR